LFDKKTFNERQLAGDNAQYLRPENDINQFSRQVQSLAKWPGRAKIFGI